MMIKPYEECDNCNLREVCKVFNGEVPLREDATSSCNAKFRHNAAIKLSEIPPAFKHAFMHRYLVNEGNEAIFNRVKPYLENIVPIIDEGTNFFFYSGNTGTGKTYLGVTILNQFILKSCGLKRFNFENPLGLFITYPELMNDLRYRRDEIAVQNKLSDVKNVPLLMLDDVGAGTMSDYIREQTYLIINYRYNQQLATIVTSNYSLNELKNEEKLGSRIVSRIVSHSIRGEISGGDMRLTR